MSLFSLDFLALLLSGVLLGGMLFFSLGFAPLVFARLPDDVAGRFIRQVFPFYYIVGATFALAAAMASALSLSTLLLGIAGFGFLFAFVWLMPAINRNRDRGVAGDQVAMATFNNLHRSSVALNLMQIVLILASFCLLAT